LNLYAYVENESVGVTDREGLIDLKFCNKLRRTIDNIKKKIEEKTQENDEDKFKLPESCSGDLENPRLSRRGHRWMIDDSRLS